MNLFQANKIVGSILGTGLVIVVITVVGNLLVSPTELEKNVYVIAVEEEEAAVEEAAPEPATGLATLLAQADVGAGRKAAKKCAACHSFDKGGRKKIGPNLWGVVGGDKARVERFAYSSALADAEGSWSYDHLDQYLANPKGFIAGTKMTFAGVKDAGARADVILFLRSLSDSPLPLPGAE